MRYTRLFCGVAAAVVSLVIVGCSDSPVRSPETEGGRDWGWGPEIYPLLHNQPAWSPDGTTIAYHSYGITELSESRCVQDLDSLGIWCIDADGGNPRLIICGPAMPTWSPDGKSIAFLFNWQVWVLDLASKIPRQLTFDGKCVDPVWCPTGQWIAYGQTTPPGGMHLIRPDGKGDRTTGIVSIRPDWFPDGKSLVGTTGHEIMRYWLDTGAEQELISLEGYIDDPVCSPDGRKIAFAYKAADSGYTQIYLIDSDGSNLTQLTTEGAMQPAWSPNGDKIVYVCCRWYEFGPRHGTLWVVNVDGSGKYQLTMAPIQK